MQLSRLEELALITRCLAGDSREAFGRLVVAYEGGLRRFLLNLTLGDASLTDDLAQETFLKAYLAIRSFRGVARFKTWLYSIAYREFLTYRRGQHPDIDLDDAPPLMAPGRHPCGDSGSIGRGASDASLERQRAHGDAAILPRGPADRPHSENHGHAPGHSQILSQP